MHAFRTAMAYRMRREDGQVRCPHCQGSIALQEAARFAAMAVCPHPNCGRRLVVEVEGRDLDGTPAEFLVQSTAGYLAEVQPLAPRTRRNWVVLRCVLMALVTPGIAGFETIRLVLAHTFPSLKMLGLVGLVVLAAVSWTAVALGWSTDRWLRMFLWRRSLVMEEPSATLTPGAG